MVGWRSYQLLDFTSARNNGTQCRKKTKQMEMLLFRGSAVALHCVFYMTFYTLDASLHPDIQMGTR